MQQYVVTGKNGKIERFLANPEILAEKNYPPLAEMNLNDLSSWPYSVGTTSDTGNDCVFDNIESEYSSRGIFGPYGDVIFIFRQDDIYFMGPIVQFAFPKPGLAADLIPFVQDKKGQLFFIGIIRKNSPGKGKPALIGGFRNVKRDHFDTAAETIIKESLEEVRMRIIPKGDGVHESIENDINLVEFPALVDIASAKPLTTIRLVGTFPTSKEERMPTGYKRVYETTAYTCLITLGGDLDEKTLAAKFKAGDDAQGMFVWNITEKGIPELASRHHNVILNSALKIIL